MRFLFRYLTIKAIYGSLISYFSANAKRLKKVQLILCYLPYPKYLISSSCKTLGLLH